MDIRKIYNSMNYLKTQGIQIIKLNVIASSLVKLEIQIDSAGLSHLFDMTFDFITEQILFELNIDPPDTQDKNDTTVLTGVVDLLYKNRSVIHYVIKPVRDLYLSGRFN